MVSKLDWRSYGRANVGFYVRFAKTHWIIKTTSALGRLLFKNLCFTRKPVINWEMSPLSMLFVVKMLLGSPFLQEPSTMQSAFGLNCPHGPCIMCDKTSS